MNLRKDVKKLTEAILNGAPVRDVLMENSLGSIPELENGPAIHFDSVEEFKEFCEKEIPAAIEALHKAKLTGEDAQFTERDYEGDPDKTYKLVSGVKDPKWSVYYKGVYEEPNGFLIMYGTADDVEAAIIDEEGNHAKWHRASTIVCDRIAVQAYELLKSKGFTVGGAEGGTWTYEFTPFVSLGIVTFPSKEERQEAWEWFQGFARSINR